MCCKNSILKIFILGAGLALGITSVFLFSTALPSLSWHPGLAPVGDHSGGSATSGDSGLADSPIASADPANAPVRILSKPKAVYTDAARDHETEGSVTLKITFLASGQVGDIKVIRGLTDGLTEQAIFAAKQIKFEPKRVNGQPVATTMVFQYGFNIY